MKPNKYTYISAVCKTLFWIIIVAILVTGTIKYYIAPLMIQKRFDRISSRFWTEKVTTGKAYFNFTKPSILRDISFYDNDGNLYLHIDSVFITLTKWEKISPKIKALDLSEIQLTVYLNDFNRLFIPDALLQALEVKKEKKQSFLESFSIQKASLHIQGSKDKLTIMENSGLSAIKKEGQWAIAASGLADNRLSQLQLEGTIGKNRDFEFDLDLKKHFSQKLSSIVLATSGFSDYLDFKGDMNAQLHVTGNLEDYTSYLFNGHIDLIDWDMLAKTYPLLNNLNGSIQIDDNHVIIDDLTSEFCQGKITLDLNVTTWDLQQFDINTFIQTKEADIDCLANIVTPLKKLRGGKTSFEFAVSTHTGDIENLTGKGFLFLEDSDLRFVPVLSDLILLMGLKSIDPLQASDAYFNVDINGPLITFNEGKLTNLISAIRIQPGGTIHYREGLLDFHVFAVGLDALEQLIKKIPLADLFFNFKDTLARFRIKGNIKDPPSTLIKKEPIQDVAQGTIDFFGGVLETGGNLSKGIVNFTTSSEDKK